MRSRPAALDDALGLVAADRLTRPDVPPAPIELRPHIRMRAERAVPAPTDPAVTVGDPL